MGAVLQPGLVPPPHMGSAHIPGACRQGGFKGIWDPRCGSYMALSATARKCLGSEEHGGAAEKNNSTLNVRQEGGEGELTGLPQLQLLISTQTSAGLATHSPTDGWKQSLTRAVLGTPQYWGGHPNTRQRDTGTPQEPSQLANPPAALSRSLIAACQAANYQVAPKTIIC